MTTSEKFEFANDDGQLLAGRLELPSSPTAFAIFAHCFTCSKNVKAASRISKALAESGIAVLRFDFTGLGNSEGDFSNTSFSSNVQDLIAAARALEQHWQAPSLLIGHSLGGTAALIASSQIESVQAVSTIGSPADPAHVTKLFGSDLKTITTLGEHEVQLAGRTFNIKKQFVDDVQSINTESYMSQLRKAVLIFHSPQDELVDINQARLIYERLKHPKSFISLDGADHLLSAERDAQFVASTLANWASRYIDKVPVNSHAKQNELNGLVPRELNRPAQGVLRVKELSGFRQLVSTADHDYVADEPVSVGGENLGMAPYDLLLAALGTCTSMTLRIYANHKNLPVESIEVELTHRKVDASECTDCESETGKVTEIKKHIHVTGDLTQEQVNRLNEIADRCPVHRTLMQEKKIRSAISLGQLNA